MSRHSHQIFDSKGGKRGLLGWLRAEPVQASEVQAEEGSAPSPDGFQPETPLKGSDEPPASSPSSSPAECPEDFPPLSLIQIGDTVQIDRSPEEPDEWTGEDFARLFLLWITQTHPATRSSWVSSREIDDEYYPRFVAAAQCPHLEFGTLTRGLGKILGKSGKRERRCMDGTGKAFWKTEYKIPREVTNVVDLAAERKRA